ncbi:MAG: hypothetical protein U1F23_10100 [Lysobacterales bacterium]
MSESTASFRAARWLAVAIFALAPLVAAAQWSTDPSDNLVIADRSGEQVQPKIAPTPDGGFYISWFDDSSGGYDVYLQRLDADGNELWPHNGILVAARDFSSTQDYGLDVDADGNALLAFRYNDANDVPQALAQMVAPDGTLLWGDPGVFVSADPGGASAPHVAALGDGTVAVGWSASDGSAVVQKLDGDGNILWAPGGIVFTPSAGFNILSDLHGDADGNVIASWVAQPSFSDHELWAQKLAALDGAPLWGTDPVKVYDGNGGALQFGYFPPFLADGAGGAVFVWYDIAGTSGEVRAQHVGADGTPAFPQNGVLASTNTTRNHFEPSGAYDADSGNTYVVWRETDSTQSHFGVYAQAIDSGGNRLWTDSGQQLVALGTLDQSEMVALPAPDGMLAAWASGDAPAAMPIQVARINADGTLAWTGGTVAITTEPTDAARLVGAISTDGYAAYAWTRNAMSFAGDVVAQDISYDGILGPPAPPNDLIFADGFDD